MRTGRLSYRRGGPACGAVAVRLLDLGLKSRDIVLVQFPNIREFIIVFFALQKIGVIPVMCLPPHRSRELTYFAELTGAKAYFFPAAVPQFRLPADGQGDPVGNTDIAVLAGDRATGLKAESRIWVHGSRRKRGRSTRRACWRPIGPIRSRWRSFSLSGGTTGVPKLIPRTHVDYLCNAKACARVLGWGVDTVFMIALPAAHNFPLGAPGMLAVLAAGGSVAMCASTDADTVFEAIERQKGTFLGVSPALLIALLNSPARHKYDLSSLRFVYAGGQKMLPELVDRTRATWSFATAGQAFGMAEGLTNLTRPDDPWEVIRETQGRPVSEADEFRIVDDNSEEVAPGAVGELITRGPYTIRGYYKSAEHNRSAFTADGFYRTGDMVRLAPDRQSSGGGPAKGPDQSRRREDQRRGNRESHARP